MALWLIPLILLALLSPLLWLLPAKRQGQRMQLRLQARRMGLGMQLVFGTRPIPARNTMCRARRQVGKTGVIGN